MRLKAGYSIASIMMVWAGSAYAYVGPGAGLSAIGAILALIAALVLMLVGFIWYPMKRIIKRRARNLDLGETPDLPVVEDVFAPTECGDSSTNENANNQP